MEMQNPDAAEMVANAPKNAKTTTPVDKDAKRLPKAMPDQNPAAQPESNAEAGSVTLGERLRAIRNGLNLTLAEAAHLTSVGASTLSKIENGQMSPTYDVLQKIAQGLKIDLVELFDTRQHALPSGRRDITRAGTGNLHTTQLYVHELLATQLSNKKFSPFKSKIIGRKPVLSATNDVGKASHAGEEFIYVLSGAVELHTDYYAPARLDVGDSVYFDSGMRHALVSVSENDAEVLWIASQN